LDLSARAALRRPSDTRAPPLLISTARACPVRDASCTRPSPLTNPHGHGPPPAMRLSPRSEALANPKVSDRSRSHANLPWPCKSWRRTTDCGMCRTGGGCAEGVQQAHSNRVAVMCQSCANHVAMTWQSCGEREAGTLGGWRTVGADGGGGWQMAGPRQEAGLAGNWRGAGE
jgi:hypothetical protein